MLNDRMISELAQMWKEVNMNYVNTKVKLKTTIKTSGQKICTVEF